MATTTTYYAVCDANGPISVRLEGASEAEALSAFEALDARAAIDAARTDAENDLEIEDACDMSESEFASALEAAGARSVRDLEPIVNAHAGTTAHLAGGWTLYAVEGGQELAAGIEPSAATIEAITSGTPGERITTEKFRIVCRGDAGPESERYSVVGHQLPDGRFLTIATGEGQMDDIWPSRDDYSPNGLDTIESITSEGVSSVDASCIGGAEVECECGQWSGEACAWNGPESETVLVEFMPEHLRESHAAAGNRGSYPANGAERIRVHADCARLMEQDDEWVSRVDAEK